MAIHNMTPLYPEIPPEIIRQTAYQGCLKWLDGLIWKDQFPKREPPQRGAEAVRILGATLGPLQRIAFIEGWDRALGEWEAQRALYRKRPAAPPAPSRRLKVLAWGASLAACLGFWAAMVLWLF